MTIFNGLKYKTSALHQDSILKDTIRKFFDTFSKVQKSEAYSLLTNPNVSTQVLQNWVNKNVPILEATRGDGEKADIAQFYSQMNTIWRWWQKNKNFPAYYDAGSPDDFKIVIPNFNINVLPPEEKQYITNSLGSYIKQSPEGLRLFANPKVWLRFQNVAHAFIPEAGETLADPMAVITDANGNLFYQKNGLYYKHGDKKGYTLEEVGVLSDKSKLSDYIKNNGSEIDENSDLNKSWKNPSTKKLSYDIVPFGLDSISKTKQTVALQITFDPFDPIFHDRSVKSFIDSIDPSHSVFRTSSRGIIWAVLNAGYSKTEVSDKLKMSDTSRNVIKQLLSWLDAKKYDISPAISLLSSYGGIEASIENTKKKSRQFDPNSVVDAISDNQKQTMVKVLSNEGLDPKMDFNQSLDVMIPKIRDLYKNGFNNDVFPEEMKRKQAEGIFLGITRNSVVMADMPGSGKTFMSSAIADYHAKLSQKEGGSGKILVLSPSGLVPQNWTTQGELLDEDELNIVGSLSRGISPEEIVKSFVSKNPLSSKEIEKKVNKIKSSFEDNNPNSINKLININGKWYKQKPSAIRQFIDPNMKVSYSESKPDKNGKTKLICEEDNSQVISSWDDEINPNKRWVIMNYNLFQEAGNFVKINEEIAKLEETAQDPLNQSLEKQQSIQRKIKDKQNRISIIKKRKQKIDRLISQIKKQNFSVAMMDESQMIKNNVGRTENVIKAISVGGGKASIKKRIAMTGTPADDNPADLYGQMRIIDHPFLYQKDTMGRSVMLNKDDIANMFFGGFGLKGNKKFNAKAFEESIEQNIPNGVRMLQLLSSFFIRREKEDINPLIPNKHIDTNQVNTLQDEDGNVIRVNDADDYASIRFDAIQWAAERKAQLMKDKGKEIDTTGLDENDGSEDISLLDEQDLGDDYDYSQNDEKSMSIQDIENAKKLISSNPAEEQEAVLRYIAHKMIPTTVKQSLNVLQGRNFEPPKVKTNKEDGEEVVAYDNSGKVIAKGRLNRWEARNVNTPERKVVGIIDTDNGEMEFERQFIVPSQPKYHNKKLFIVTKFVDVANKIKKSLEEHLGTGGVDVVTGEQGDLGLRTEVTENFKNVENPLRALIMTMKLGSVGFNFQVADTAIFNDLSWNPSENEQASDRVYRITSPRDVSIIYNFLGVGESAAMLNMVLAKENSNKEIQKCIKDAYEYKKNLGDGSPEYMEKIQNASRRYLKEIAKSMARVEESAAIKQGRKNVKLNKPSKQLAASNWYSRQKR